MVKADTGVVSSCMNREIYIIKAINRLRCLKVISIGQRLVLTDSAHTLIDVINNVSDISGQDIA